jgi:hypothetical protein
MVSEISEILMANISIFRLHYQTRGEMIVLGTKLGYAVAESPSPTFRYF